MDGHPLDVRGPPAAKQKKYLQPRFKQIGPVGDGPRIILAAQSGMGKTTAAMVLLKEYLRIVDRVWLVSSTIDIDPAYKEAKRLVTEKYKREGIDLDDPEENPFRDNLDALKQILSTMQKRTQEAEDDRIAPAHLVMLDDLMANGAGGYRYNDDVLKLFSAGRHSGAITILMTQDYKRLSKAARLQATHLGLWAVQEVAKKEIFDELAGRQGMTKEQLETAFATATARPHGFLFISYNAPPGEKLWSGFSRKLVNK